jgi:anti-sigma factor RsiW
VRLAGAQARMGAAGGSWWQRLIAGRPGAPVGLLGLAALLLVAAVAWGAWRAQTVTRSNDLVAEEALSSSMRSLIAGPLTDVASSDRHTVKPWFAGKLDYSPVVVDLAAQGFPLQGGRLDYLGGRPVAALVYGHGQHVINLYTWSSAGSADSAPQSQSYQGYNVLHWTQAGMAYWAVSDMDTAELRQFAGLLAATH